MPVSAHTQQQTTTAATQPKVWVDPASLPNHGDISDIGGNAPDYIKQLNFNTYISYGVGNEDTFGYKVGKSVRFVDMSIHRNKGRNGRLEATTVAEIMVTKGVFGSHFLLGGILVEGRGEVAAALQAQVTE
jgi:acyl-coenzyme A thioesterase 13